MWVWSLEPGVPQKGASLSPALFVGQQWTSSFLEETGLLWGWTGSSAYRPHSSSSALAVAPVCIMKAASNSQPPPRWALFWGTLGQRAHEKCHVSGPKVTNLTTETHLRVLSHSPLPPTTFYPPPPQPLFTCTGETLLEDVSAAHIAPGVLAPGFKVVTLSGFLLHPGVLLSRWEDGPHVRRSEPSPPAPQRPSPEVTFHPVIGCVCFGVLPLGTRYRLGRLPTLEPGRLQALKTGGLRWRMPPDSLHHHRALVGFGDPHSGPRRRPGALRSFVEPPRGCADVNRLECRVIRDRTACRDVLPTEVHHARASLPAEPRESSECDVVLMTPVMTPARAWRRSACCLLVNRLRWWCVQGAAEPCKETTILKNNNYFCGRKIILKPD